MCNFKPFLKIKIVLLFLLIFLKTSRNRLWLMQKNLKEIKCHIHKRDYFKSLVVRWNQFGFVF
jgi:hypothetical protein